MTKTHLIPALWKAAGSAFAQPATEANTCTPTAAGPVLFRTAPGSSGPPPTESATFALIPSKIPGSALSKAAPGALRLSPAGGSICDPIVKTGPGPVFLKAAAALSNGSRTHVCICASIAAPGPWICPAEGCPKRFTRNTLLKSHLAVHSDARPWICPLEGCDKRFARASHRRFHLQAHSEAQAPGLVRWAVVTPPKDKGTPKCTCAPVIQGCQSPSFMMPAVIHRPHRTGNARAPGQPFPPRKPA